MRTTSPRSWEGEAELRPLAEPPLSLDPTAAVRVLLGFSTGHGTRHTSCSLTLHGVRGWIRSENRDVVLCRDYVRACARLIFESNVGLLPVTGVGGKIVADPLRDAATPVHRVMSMPPVTCGPEHELGTIVEIMLAAKKSRIVVVNRSGRCLGMISIFVRIEREFSVDREIVPYIRRHVCRRNPSMARCETRRMLQRA